MSFEVVVKWSDRAPLDVVVGDNDPATIGGLIAFVARTLGRSAEGAVMKRDGQVLEGDMKCVKILDHGDVLVVEASLPSAPVDSFVAHSSTLTSPSPAYQTPPPVPTNTALSASHPPTSQLPVSQNITPGFFTITVRWHHGSETEIQVHNNLQINTIIALASGDTGASIDGLVPKRNNSLLMGWRKLRDYQFQPGHVIDLVPQAPGNVFEGRESGAWETSPGTK